MIAFAAAVERLSEHPLAEAVVAAAEERGLIHAPASGFQAAPGLGASAMVEGQRILIGNQRSLESQGIVVVPLLETAERLSAEAPHGIRRRGSGACRFHRRLRSSEALLSRCDGAGNDSVDR